jgi:hypothetical protein
MEPEYEAPGTVVTTDGDHDVDAGELRSSLADFRAKNGGGGDAARRAPGPAPTAPEGDADVTAGLDAGDDAGEEGEDAAAEGEGEGEDQAGEEDADGKKPSWRAKLRAQIAAKDAEKQAVEKHLHQAATLTQEYYQDNIRLEQEAEDLKGDAEEARAYATQLEQKLVEFGWQPDANEVRARELGRENAKLKRQQERDAKAREFSTKQGHEVEVERHAKAWAEEVRGVAGKFKLDPRELGERAYALGRSMNPRTGKPYTTDDVAKLMVVAHPQNQKRKEQVQVNGAAPKRPRPGGVPARTSYANDHDEAVAALKAFRGSNLSTSRG